MAILVAERREPGPLKRRYLRRIMGVSFSSGRYCSYLSTDEVGGEVAENHRNQKSQQAQSFSGSGLRHRHGMCRPPA